MKSRYRIVGEEYPYFVTCTIVEWLPVFTKIVFFDIIIDALIFCQKQKKFKVHAFVILENHLHLIVTGENLSKGIRDFKSFTARKILETTEADKLTWLLNQFEYFKKAHKTDSRFQVWQEGSHPQQIQNEMMLRQKTDYIHMNPVERGYVRLPQDWRYSSAEYYRSGIDECGVMIDTAPEII